jgi:hypothetical protein
MKPIPTETIMKKIKDTAFGVVAIIHIIVIPDACFKN